MTFFSLPAWSLADQPAQRAQAQKLLQDGNYAEALALFRQLCVDPNEAPTMLPTDLTSAVQCMQNLGDLTQVDVLLDETLTAQKANWRAWSAVAATYRNLPHYGSLIDGKFHRGPHREGGRFVNAERRDYVRSLQLMQEAMPLVDQHDNKPEAAQFYKQLAEILRAQSVGPQAWRFQLLTDLSSLPDYEDFEGMPQRFGRGGYYPGGSSSGAPVDAQGEPIFHSAPRSWTEAQSDGQRWRWALNQAVELDPEQLVWRTLELAHFAQEQFGVQTMRQSPWWSALGGGPEESEESSESDDADAPVANQEQRATGTFALHTLGDDETIAKLATGVKRFKLPDDYNFIKLYQSAATSQSPLGNSALLALANLFADRRQYDRSAQYWDEYLKAAQNNDAHALSQLRQIRGNWGQFEPVGDSFTVGNSQLEYRFRNGNQVTLEARPINIEKLVADIKSYLRSQPKELDWTKFSLEQIGYRIVANNEQQYVGEAVGSWKRDLEPAQLHFDRRVTLDVPVKQSGAYLVTAKMRDGNTSRVILWVHDTVIVRKPLDSGQLYLLADAATGRPLPNMNLEFFGFRHEVVPNTKSGQMRVVTSNFATKTNQQGLSRPNAKDLNGEFQWMTIARGTEGSQKRLATWGFQGIWHAQHTPMTLDQTKALFMTDRPVYRPGHEVQWKLWVGQAKYELDDSSAYAGKSIEVIIRDPNGEEVTKTTAVADQFGGVAGKWTLPANAKLGVYSLDPQLGIEAGGNTFRVEEYKKPEYEVTVESPDKPIRLGEAFQAKVTAKYYFGAPVTDATVHYKVLRHNHSDNWYPVMPWDWCFGSGYWWFAYDTPWYPGFYRWVGCRRPAYPWIWPGQMTPPELIAEADAPIGPDGTLAIDIDTALAKELLGNTDHRYEITAEVRDASRRTIVGQGQVTAARKAFQVYTWVNRGYYRVGQTVAANFQAQTVDHKPVVARGTATLYKVTYNAEREPVETAVQSWDVQTDETGRAQLQLQASAAGQFRLSCQLQDDAGHKSEGAYLFTVIGEGFNGAEYRFNAVELIPDQREYAPGQKVQLQINTDRAGSYVWLFVRPQQGVYTMPQLVRLDGKSTVVELNVDRADMPNFFVEAVTVSDGQLHQEIRELHVPPEKRVVQVEVLPDQTNYLPGSKASVQLKVTDLEGKPFVGSTVVAIYDKSLDYIAGPQSTPNIKEFFWKWRRDHQPVRWTNLERYEGILLAPGEEMMQPIGIFGDSVVEELSDMGGMALPASRSKAMRGGFGGGGYGGIADRAMPAQPMSMMMEAAAAPMNAAADAAGVGGYGGGGGGSPELATPQVRTQFADTALWVAALNTDAQGLARVELSMPENLTTWKIRCWTMGAGTRVGEGDAEVITTKNLIIRLQAPRFLITGDRVTLSANVHNYLKSEKQVTVKLEVPTENFTSTSDWTTTITVPAGGERRVDWPVTVRQEGSATIRMSALTDEESDAMEISLPVKIRGADIQQAWAGTLLADAPATTLKWNVPAERREGSAKFTFRWSPTLAGAMIDALPYLAEYPYGCTEQTLNRFLPTVITHRTLQRLGVDLAQLAKAHTNLNAQQLGEAVDRAQAWKRFDREAVFDAAEVDRMVQEGLKQLAEQQMEDGGWGWFGGWGGHSTPHTTAVVVRGLLVAQASDVAVVPDMLQRGVAWLERYQAEQVVLLERGAAEKRDEKLPYKLTADDLDALIYQILVDAGKDNPPMREFVYRDRTQLSHYAQALLGLALHRVGDTTKLNMVLRNLDQFVAEDESNETAYFKLPPSIAWWAWYGSETEIHATYLKLLSKVEPRGARAARLVKYLVNNRQHGSYWKSTRDTALAVEAFADYLQATGELGGEMKVELWVDGELKKTIDVTPANLLTLDNTFELSADQLSSGEHQIEIRRQGRGAVYFNAYLNYFSQEENIPAAGLEVQIERQYYRLTPEATSDAVAGQRGQVVEQQRAKYRREKLASLQSLQSGELVEVELNITSKNDYEYLLIKDLKPAGCEPVELRSGYLGDSLGSYAEFRDDHAAFFVQLLTRGTHTLSYRLRAETPGEFSALPARVEAMYAPELKGNSADYRMAIED